ncbi:S26 family signal peptidase [Nonomuraea sp. SBT364]|uniref:S26 family signal peptidase n=1 Tax=Nonomuraea sp. SBT364 TaxID=1580530 RepID=UPI00066DA5EB|nr:S26 family signal peptidase [Nonomuraea sp. SBT364]
MIWWLMALGAPFVVAAWLRRTFVVVTVWGQSMSPTLLPNERVLVRRAPLARVRRGDIVILRSGEEDPGAARRSDLARSWIIKRVLAAPGDVLPKGEVPSLADAPEDRVPPGRLVVIGDNPARSTDSRTRGYFAGEDLLGVMVRKMAR